MAKSVFFEHKTKERLVITWLSVAVVALPARMGHAKCPSPVPTYEELVAAMEMDSSERFEDLLQCTYLQGNPVDMAVQAARHNNEKLFKLLVLLPEDADSAMTAAVRKGDAKAAVFMIKHGVDVDARDELGNTILMRACNCKKVNNAAEMVRALLRVGANPNLKNYDEEDVLDLVDESCPKKIGRMLKSYGARGGNNKALRKAAISGDVEGVVDALVSGATVNPIKSTPDSGEVSPLRLAVSNNHIEAVRMILAFGADFDVSAFITALRDGSTDIAGLLIDAGPDPKKVNWGKDLPLHLAVYKEYGDIVKLLIDAGVNVNSRARSGKTPLHLAVERENDELVEMLIKADAIIDAKDNESRTSFSIAAEKKNEKLVRRLYNACNSENCSQDGKTPLHSAIENGQYDAAKILIKLGWSINTGNRDGKTPLHLAIENENDELAKMLIKLGAKINTRDAGNETPLHVAAEKENLALVKLLVDAGAKISCARGGTTPLHTALRRGNYKIVNLLLSIASPQDIDRQDEHGDTALHLAAEKASDKEGLSVVAEILKRTQNPNALTNRGKNALSYARNDAVRRLLATHGVIDLEAEAAEAKKKAEAYNRRKQRREKLGKVLPHVFSVAAGAGYLTGGVMSQIRRYGEHPKDNPFAYVNYFALEAMLSVPGIILLSKLENAQYLAPFILGLAALALVPSVVYGIAGWKNLDSEGAYYAATVVMSIAIPICISVPVHIAFH